MSHQGLQMFKNENNNEKVISGQERKTIKYIVSSLIVQCKFLIIKNLHY